MGTTSRQKPAAPRKSGERPESGSPAAVRGGEKLPSGASVHLTGKADSSVPAGELHSQAVAYEAAVREFHAGNYGGALALFEEALAGPAREVAHSARLHARMCESRLAKPQLSLQSPDEHYDYAIALINERRLEQAELHLLQALAQNPKADHLFYALALCRGLAGDLEAAYHNLRRAIELQPKNRAAARNDPDFAEIARVSPILELLYPERAASS